MSDIIRQQYISLTETIQLRRIPEGYMVMHHTLPDADFYISDSLDDAMKWFDNRMVKDA